MCTWPLHLKYRVHSDILPSKCSGQVFSKVIFKHECMDIYQPCAAKSSRLLDCPVLCWLRDLSHTDLVGKETFCYNKE